MKNIILETDSVKAREHQQPADQTLIEAKGGAYEFLRLALPQWKGEKCKGVAVDLTGGLGDFVLLFARLLKVAALDKGIPLVLIYGSGAPVRAKSELCELMLRQSWCGDPSLIVHGDIDQVLPFLDRCEACVDMHALLDLFSTAGTIFLDNCPAPLWRLAPDADLRDQLASDLPVVGLCHEAGKEYFPDPDRSLGQHNVERLIRSTPQVKWVNLHLSKLDLPGVVNIEHPSVAKLAALVDACDAVVSVDTFVAHFAASLGKPTFVLLNTDPPGWFWKGNPSWYPTMRVLRNWGGLHGAVDAVIPFLGSITAAKTMA